MQIFHGCEFHHCQASFGDRRGLHMRQTQLIHTQSGPAQTCSSIQGFAPLNEQCEAIRHGKVRSRSSPMPWTEAGGAAKSEDRTRSTDQPAWSGRTVARLQSRLRYLAMKLLHGRNICGMVIIIKKSPNNGCFPNFTGPWKSRTCEHQFKHSSPCFPYCPNQPPFCRIGDCWL